MNPQAQERAALIANLRDLVLGLAELRMVNSALDVQQAIDLLAGASTGAGEGQRDPMCLCGTPRSAHDESGCSLFEPECESPAPAAVREPVSLPAYTRDVEAQPSPEPRVPAAVPTREPSLRQAVRDVLAVACDYDLRDPIHGLGRELADAMDWLKAAVAAPAAVLPEPATLASIERSIAIPPGATITAARLHLASGEVVAIPTDALAAVLPEPGDVEAIAQGHVAFGRQLGDDYGRGLAQAGADILAALRRRSPGTTPDAPEGA